MAASIEELLSLAASIGDPNLRASMLTILNRFSRQAPAAPALKPLSGAPSSVPLPGVAPLARPPLPMNPLPSMPAVSQMAGLTQRPSQQTPGGFPILRPEGRPPKPAGFTPF